VNGARLRDPEPQASKRGATIGRDPSSIALLGMT